MTTAKTLDQALKDILKEDHKVTKWDARALKELILADGAVTKEERQFLEQALHHNVFDAEAQQVLSDLLLREEAKLRR